MINNEADISMNYGNILLALSENQNNILQLNVDSSQLAFLSTDAKDDDQNNENEITTYIVNGVNLLSNSFLNDSQIRSEPEKCDDTTGLSNEPRIISILIKPPNSINNVDNSNTNGTFNPADASTVGKDLAQNIPSQLGEFGTLNPEAPKEVTILVPEEELGLLGQSYGPEKPSRTGTIDYPLPETDIQLNIRAFDLIFYNSHKIQMPNPMWGYHKNSLDKDIIIFSKARWFKSDVLIPPIYEKQVIFHESDDIKIYINNKFSPLEVRRPRDIGELELILRHVDETRVCPAGPSIAECDTGHCAQKDYAVGRWRHKLCPIVLGPDEATCKFCATINQVLRYPKKKRLPFGRRSAPARDKES